MLWLPAETVQPDARTCACPRRSGPRCACSPSCATVQCGCACCASPALWRPVKQPRAWRTLQPLQGGACRCSRRGRRRRQRRGWQPWLFEQPTGKQLQEMPLRIVGMHTRVCCSVTALQLGVEGGLAPALTDFSSGAMLAPALPTPWTITPANSSPQPLSSHGRAVGGHNALLARGPRAPSPGRARRGAAHRANRPADFGGPEAGPRGASERAPLAPFMFQLPPPLPCLQACHTLVHSLRSTYAGAAVLHLQRGRPFLPALPGGWGGGVCTAAARPGHPRRLCHLPGQAHRPAGQVHRLQG